MRDEYISAAEKRCIRCGKLKPIDSFFALSRADRRPRAQCKACHAERRSTDCDPCTPGSIERFASKITVTDGCWLWTGMRSNGYGMFRINRSPSNRWLAHRLMWRLVNGEIQPGMVVRHLCGNRGCVCPEHLAIGTQRDNMHDAIKDGTHASVQIRNRYLAKTEEERAADQRRYRANQLAKHHRTKQLKGYARGERVPGARLTEDAVHDIRSRYAAGETLTELARAYNVFIGTIRYVVLRVTWKHVD